MTSRGRRSGSDRRARAGERHAQPSKNTVERIVSIQQSMTRSLEADSEDEDEGDYTLVVSRALELYKEASDGQVDSVLSHTSTSCIICLSAVRRSDPVWSCGQCYCIFHLHCIQAWAKDRVQVQDGPLSRELFPGVAVFWSCPKCRKDYDQQSIPNLYVCYCGKKVDPPVDAWLLPHSCGEVCGHSGGCSHSCLSLCHPGPCPPCPKTVSLKCFCGKSPPRMKRCGAEGWSCGRVCGRVLSCGLHTCEQSCHDGECPPCSELIVQPCLCGKQAEEMSCDSPGWSCDQPCGKALSCGHHVCGKVCHSGPCGSCPRALPRTCPCGKTEHTLPCLVDVPTCGDTCDKLLSCGVHRCTRRCHHGECGQCLQVSARTCRCGRKTKSLVCSHEFLCDSKCQKLRDCGIHHCKKKCCDGHCPPCEQVCNKLLACRNHKCPAPCHQGRCYPCVRTTEVVCHCGATSVTVPCGRERHTRAPKCRQLCTLPSNCHHPARKPHYCHPPPCPPCALVCGLELACGHKCETRCHSTPRPKPRPPGLPPWVNFADSSLVSDPCPQCRHPVTVWCRGGHESEERVCSLVGEYSCGRQCGRLLACGNHLCTRGCHRVNPPLEGRAGEDCVQCDSECLKPRPSGCLHTCPSPCHPDECPRCEALVKTPCHCGTLTLFIKCYEWAGVSSARRDAMKSCNSQCVKMLSCGHRCTLNCHNGPCADPALCSRRVTVRCPCGHLKRDSKCASRVSLSCNQDCQRISNERKQVREKEVQQAHERELALKKQAEEALQRQLRPRKRKRKIRTEEEAIPTESFLQAHRVMIMTTLVTLVLAMAVVWLLV